MTGAYCKVDLADCQSQRELAILASPELPHDEYLESIASDGEPSPVYEAVQHPFPPLLLDTSVNELSKGPSEDVEVQEAAQQLQSKRQFAKEMAFVVSPSDIFAVGRHIDIIWADHPEPTSVYGRICAGRRGSYTLQGEHCTALRVAF